MKTTTVYLSNLELLARNVSNSDEIKKYTEDLSEYAIYEGGKKWIKSNLYRYIINEFKGTLLVSPPDNAPTWMLDAFARGDELYIIKLTEEQKQNIRHTVDFLNTEDTDWSRVSYPDIEKKVQQWDIELQKQAKTEAISSDYKPVLPIENLQWVEIITQEGLEDEGAKMGHCVGSYWNQVKDGKVKIYSLRGMNFDNPKVTIEISTKNKTWRISQVKGNSNTKPEKYKNQIKEFLLYLYKQLKKLNTSCLDIKNLNLGIYSLSDKLFSSKKEAYKVAVQDLKKLPKELTLTEDNSYYNYYEILGNQLFKDRKIFNHLDDVKITTSDLKYVISYYAKHGVTLTIESQHDKTYKKLLAKLDTTKLFLIAETLVVLDNFPKNLKNCSITLVNNNFDIKDIQIGNIFELKSANPTLRNKLTTIGLQTSGRKKDFEYDKSIVKNKYLQNIIKAVETGDKKKVYTILKKYANTTSVTSSYASAAVEFLFELLFQLQIEVNKNNVPQIAETFKALTKVVPKTSKLYSALSYMITGELRKMIQSRMVYHLWDTFEKYDPLFRRYNLNSDNYKNVKPKLSIPVKITKSISNRAKVVYKKGDRILVKIDKQAFLGTISAIRTNIIYIIFDDGDKGKLKNTSKLIIGKGIKRKVKKPISLKDTDNYII